MSSNKEKLEVEGTVQEVLPNMTFEVLLDTGKTIHAFLSGKMRLKNIRVLIGDRVTVELSVYDLTKGRITYRQSTYRQGQ